MRNAERVERSRPGEQDEWVERSRPGGPVEAGPGVEAYRAWRPMRLVACGATIAGALPYLVMKAMWLAGHPVGAQDASGAAVLLDTRHLIGNAITAGMELVAIGLVLVLTADRGRRVPAYVVLAPAWVGTGLLAPIVLGLPIGLALQGLAGGSPAPAEQGTQGWIFLVADGGFLVQGLGLLGAFLGHVRGRWPAFFGPGRRSRVPGGPPAAGRERSLPVGGPAVRRTAWAAGVVCGGYALTLAATPWIGPVLGGPAGFETVAQQAYLVTNAALVLLGAIALPRLVGDCESRDGSVPGHGGADRRGTGRQLALGWLGSAVAVMTPVALVALGNDGSVRPANLIAAGIGTASGLVLTGCAVSGWRRERERGRALQHPRRNRGR